VKYCAIFAFEINHVMFFCVSLYNSVINFKKNKLGGCNPTYRSWSARKVGSVEFGTIHWEQALWLRRESEGKMLAKIPSAPLYPTSWLKLGEYLSGLPDDTEPIMWTVILSDLVLEECSPNKDSWFLSWCLWYVPESWWKYDQWSACNSAKALLLH